MPDKALATGGQARSALPGGGAQKPNVTPSNYLNNLFAGPQSNSLENQFANAYGTLPSQPTFNSVLDSSNQLPSQYQIQNQGPVTAPNYLPNLEQTLSGINVDPTALNAYKDFATSKGPSAYAQPQLSAADAQGNATTQNAMSQLATQGGLRQGAAQSIALQGARNTMAQKQNIMGQDNQNKLSALSQIPGMEVQATQPGLQKAGLWSGMAGQTASNQLATATGNRDYSTNVNAANLGNIINQLGSQNAFNLGMYGNQMQGAAAQATGQATQRSGKK